MGLVAEGVMSGRQGLTAKNNKKLQIGLLQNVIFQPMVLLECLFVWADIIKNFMHYTNVSIIADQLQYLHSESKIV